VWSWCSPMENDGRMDLWIRDLTRVGVRQVTNGPAGQLGDWGPRWSPDGKLIVFDRLDRDDQGTFIVDTNGGEPRRITDEAMRGGACWSPDGKGLLYARQEAAGGYGLSLVSVETGAERLLIREVGRANSPDWWAPREAVGDVQEAAVSWTEAATLAGLPSPQSRTPRAQAD